MMKIKPRAFDNQVCILTLSLLSIFLNVSFYIVVLQNLENVHRDAHRNVSP